MRVESRVPLASEWHNLAVRFPCGERSLALPDLRLAARQRDVDGLWFCGEVRDLEIGARDLRVRAAVPGCQGRAHVECRDRNIVDGLEHRVNDDGWLDVVRNCTIGDEVHGLHAGDGWPRSISKGRWPQACECRLDEYRIVGEPLHE